MQVIIMGVCGCGKSSLGRALALVHGLPFIEGDDLHPAANVAKMSQGTPLTDEDRWPWLDAVGTAMTNLGSSVASCSSLRRTYRDRLRIMTWYCEAAFSALPRNGKIRGKSIVAIAVIFAQGLMSVTGVPIP
jgi:carbohydrate kinase (thermoresistant glucokinase family)